MHLNMFSNRLPIAKLSGYAPDIPTPFDGTGDVDYRVFEQFCDRQIRAGGKALVVCGTTGESATLTRAQHAAIIRAACGVAGQFVPVIAGAGSNSTSQA